MPLLATSAAGANGDGLGALLAFDDEGRFLGKFSDDGRIADPRGLSVNRRHGLLFLNSGGDRVLALDADGMVVCDTGQIEAFNPGGGIFGPDGRYYVGSRSRRNVMVFGSHLKPDGENFLRLMARVIDDSSEEAAQVVREKLDDAALVFIDALQICYPNASRYAAASAYIYVSASLLKFLVGSKRLFRLAQAASPADTSSDDRDRLTRFLVAGIEAALHPHADGTAHPKLATGHDGAAATAGVHP